MKIREKLNQTRKRLFLLAVFSWVLVIVALIFSDMQNNDSFPPLTLIPFGLFMFTCFYSIFGMRCPKCKGVLGYAICWPPTFKISKKIKFCPFCGIELDSEIEIQKIKGKNIMSDPFIQIYSLRHDRKHIKDVQNATLNTNDYGLVVEHGLFGSDEWWDAIGSGKIKIHKIEGVISKVFMSGHNDYPEFEIDDGSEKTCWTREISEIPNNHLSRQQKDNCYKVGKPVRLTYVKQKFKKSIKVLGSESRCVLEIWIKSN